LYVAPIKDGRLGSVKAIAFGNRFGDATIDRCGYAHLATLRILRLNIRGSGGRMEENLGKKLRRAREAAGLTVDDAVYRAKLPRAVVEALETDDFGFFTSPLYARSFLKQYGEYVGMDVEPWIYGLVPTALIDGEAVEALIEIGEPVPMPLVRERKKETGGGGAMAAMWLVVITGGMVWGGMEVYRGFERKHSEAPAAVPAPYTDTTTKAERPEAASAEEEPNATTERPEPPRRAIIVREE
jgi:cytoskeletal protein RodZ